ncbi:MAG TPA: 2-hydroxyacid dehydrogenase [Trebonia sp.]|nr:2-hydroxyacid dehydrogenase [Trebonia sp.]
MTRVWLPDPPELFKGLPDGMVADVWTGGEPLPASTDEVEVIVPPPRVRPETLAAIARLPSLKLVQLTSAGAERVIPYIPAHVTLCNARGAHDAATAEWTVGAIVAHLRNFPRFGNAQSDGRWDFTLSESVSGKRVLIVGSGSIGGAVERRLAGWEVTIERLARTRRPGVLGLEDLPEALPKADVVVILVPVTEQTTRMVNAEFLASMKDGALLVNAARGAIVDTNALLKELSAHRIKAALDVTDPEPLPAGHPLWTAPGLLLTPHVGGAITQVTERAYAVVRAQLARYAAGEPLHNVIGARGY